jgi:hypothetical protein
MSALKSKSQYGEEFSSEDIHEEEVPANYKDREKQAEPLKEGVVDIEGRRETISQIIYCPLPKYIIKEPRLLTACFPWEQGDQEQKITMQKYW